MEKQPLEEKALIQHYRYISEEIAAQPGVSSLTYVHIVPFSGNTGTTTISGPVGSLPRLYMNTIGPGHFATMHTPLLAGREFL